jgi:hypothetical protein
VETALTIYIGLFVLVTGWAIHTESSLGMPSWKVGLGALSAGLGAAGMILFLRGAVTPTVSSCWKAVFPCLVAQAVVDGAWDLRYGTEKLESAGEDEELGPGRRRALVAASFATGVVALAPYFYVNFRVAFG